MAGCHGNAAANTEMCGGKINLLGAATADIQHRHTLLTQTLNKGCLNGFAG